MQTITNYEVEEVRKGLRRLAGMNQDGARDVNGIGFNKMHSGFGEELAGCSVWSEAQTESACKIASVYLNTQLADLDASTKVFVRTTVKEASERKVERVAKAAQQDKKIDWSDLQRKYIISFPFPNPEVLAATRALSQRGFDNDKKVWTAPSSAADELKKYGETFGFLFTETAKTAMAMPRAIEYGVELYGATFGVRATSALKEEIKTIPGREWRSDLTRWIIPVSEWAAVKAFAERHLLLVNPSINWEEMETEANEGLAAATAMSAEPLDMPDYMSGDPMPFQWAGCHYLIDKRLVIEADDPGLGKTLQSIYSIAHLNQWPVLVVCPSTVKATWRNELAKWAKGKSAFIIDGQKGFIPNGYDMYIVNWGLLSHRVEQLSSFGFKAIIGDESFAVKNNKTQVTKAMKKIAASIPEGGCRFLLNGTPVGNKPYELVSQLGILGVLKLFGGSGQFMREYCGGWSGGAASPRMLQKLNKELLKHCMVRRTKEQVLTELPPVLESIVPVPVNNWSEYERAEADLIKFIADRAFNVAKAVSGLDDKAAMAEARVAAVRAQQAEVLVRISTLRQISARCKKESAKQFVNSLVEQGQKVLLFAHHREITQEFAASFKAPAIIGGLSNEIRQQAVDRFQNDPECKVIVLSIDAAGVGLTLTAGSSVVFVEQAWSPSRMNQAVSRAHRIGQPSTVNSYILTPDKPDTIDDMMLDILSRKKAITDAIHDGRITEDDDSSAVSQIIQMYSERG